MPGADDAAHAVSAVAAGGQLLGVVDQRGENDDSHADEEDEEAQNAGARLQRGHDHLEARVVVEELEEAHDADRAEQVPRRMHLVVGREQEVAVDEVAIEPGAVEHINPVDDVFEELDPVWRDEAFDDKLEREPRDAHVLDVVEHGRRSLTPVHCQVQYALKRRALAPQLFGHHHSNVVAAAEEAALAEVVHGRQAERENWKNDEEYRQIRQQLF